MAYFCEMDAYLKILLFTTLFLKTLPIIKGAIQVSLTVLYYLLTL